MSPAPFQRRTFTDFFGANSRYEQGERHLDRTALPQRHTKPEDE